MKPWLKYTLWSLFLIGMVYLGILVKEKMLIQKVPEPQITIHVEGEDAFITKPELKTLLEREHFIYPNQLRKDLKIEKIEAFLNNISQVREAHVFQKINGSWSVEVSLRKPIARIYNKYGETFYLDSEGNTVETTSSHTARTLVFTGHIFDRANSISVNEIINNDTLISIRKLDDIYRISDYVCNDPLFHSLIGQVHLEKNGDFILVPLVGDQKIVLGSARTETDVKDKFEKLRIFYNQAIPYEGWNAYKEISLKFEDQIVCKKKETNE